MIKLCLMIIGNSLMCYFLGVIHTEIKIEEKEAESDATEYR